tara:strand:+ start:296 stop:772 length:477 start_codon:yes stop_codon:yes gene_type:complete
MQVIVDEYKREIQKLKMQISDMTEEAVRLNGFKQMVMEDPDKFEDKRTYKSLKEHATDMSYENEGRAGDIETLKEENRKLKKRAEEAEGENTIIKGIGNNSPEMRALQAKVKEAEAINKLHQELNGKLQVELTELKEDNKKLSYQIEDKVNAMRKSGM